MCAVPLGVAMRLLPVKEDPDNFGGQQGLENVEEPPPGGKHEVVARRRTLVRKWVGVLLQLGALLAVPVLAAVCYRMDMRPQILDFYKF